MDIIHLAAWLVVIVFGGVVIFFGLCLLAALISLQDQSTGSDLTNRLDRSQSPVEELRIGG